MIEERGEVTAVNPPYATVIIWNLSRTNASLKKSLIECGKYDVFICGHTHKKENSINGKTLILNPGSAHSKLQDLDEIKKPMVLIYDTIKRSFSFLEIT